MPSYRGILHEPAEPSQQSATSRAYLYLKQSILRCELGPGAAIFEGEIATTLDMSKTPVREALGMLVHEGFVEVRPRQGYRVTEITMADVQDIFHLRLLLEPAAAELAAERATTEQLHQLRQLVSGDPPATYEDQVLQSGEFHRILADASGNVRLAATLKNLLEEMERLFFLGLDLSATVDHHGAEHRELVDALLKANHHLAGEIARRQVETSRMEMLEAILSSLSAPGAGIDASEVKLHSGES